MKRIKLRNIKQVGKKCSTCQEWKLNKGFGKLSRNKDGLNYTCKDCRNLEMRNTRKTKKGLLTQIYQDQKRNSKKRGHPLPNYTLTEFQEWGVQRDDFNKIYKTWQENNYISGLNPSADRLDDEKPYTFDNLRFTTWKENNDKVHKQMREGKHFRVQNPVVQLDLEGNFIKEWVNPMIARRTLPKCKGIYDVIHGKYETAGGYKWMYLKDYLKNTIQDIDNQERDLQTNPIKPSQIHYNEDTCLVTIS